MSDFDRTKLYEVTFPEMIIRDLGCINSLVVWQPMVLLENGLKKLGMTW